MWVQRLVRSPAPSICVAAKWGRGPALPPFPRGLLTVESEKPMGDQIVNEPLAFHSDAFEERLTRIIGTRPELAAQIARLELNFAAFSRPEPQDQPCRSLRPR